MKFQKKDFNDIIVNNKENNFGNIESDVNKNTVKMEFQCKSQKKTQWP